MKWYFLWILMPALISGACNSNEISNSKEVPPEEIYFDYQVSGKEDDEFITVLIQYRVGGSNGSTLVLEKPSRVELDGELLHQDSSRMTGAYYEIQKPVREFVGDHSIVFTDINHKKYEEVFHFQPIFLKTEIPATLRRANFVFELEGLDTLDYVRVFMSDSAIANEEINRIDTVRNGRVTISESALKSLDDGPVHLELYREQEKSVRNRTLEGGRLFLSYGINRDFILAPVDTLLKTEKLP